MDEIDREIVRILHANGRLNQERIAREVKLSRPAVHARIRRLEEEGVIRGYKALMAWGGVRADRVSSKTPSPRGFDSVPC